MTQEHLSTTTIKQWAQFIQERKLSAIAIPMLDILQVWGFVGEQFLWMLTPFLGEQKLAPYVQALERPENLQQLQRYLIERDEQR